MKRLYEFAAALWWRDATNTDPAWRVNWVNHVQFWLKDTGNFTPLWVETLKRFDSLSPDEQACIRFVIDSIIHLTAVRGEGLQNIPGGLEGKPLYHVSVWGVDNALGWLEKKLGGIVVSSIRRPGEYPHNGHAVDFGGYDRMDWIKLGRVFDYNIAGPGTWEGGLGVGFEKAEKHLHVDHGVARRRFMETTKVINDPAWPVYRVPNDKRWIAAMHRMRKAFFLADSTLYTVDPDPAKERGATQLPLMLAAVGGAMGYENKNYPKAALYAAAGFAVGRILDAGVSKVQAIGDEVTDIANDVRHVWPWQ